MQNLIVLTFIVMTCGLFAQDFNELSTNLAEQAKAKDAANKTVAVLSFDFIGENSQSESVKKEVQKLIKAAIIKNTKFTLVASEVVEQIEKEVYEKQSSGLIDHKMKARIGFGYGVKAIISGQIKYKPADGSTQIIAELTDTETHEAIASAELNTTQFSKELDKSVVLKEKGMQAALFSTVIPGVGQMYKGKSVRGSIFLVAEAGLIVGALIFNSQYHAAIKDRDAVYPYSYNFANPDAAYNKYDDDAKSAKNLTNAFWIGVAVAHLYNIYDAYTVEPENLSTAFFYDGQKAGLNLAWKF